MTLLVRSSPEIGPSGAPRTHGDDVRAVLSNAANLTPRHTPAAAGRSAHSRSGPIADGQRIRRRERCRIIRAGEEPKLEARDPIPMQQPPGKPLLLGMVDRPGLVILFPQRNPHLARLPLILGP